MTFGGSKVYMNDYVTPRFEKLRSAGAVVNNPADATYVTSSPYVTSNLRLNPTVNGWEQDDGATISFLFGGLVGGTQADGIRYPAEPNRVARLGRLATLAAWGNVQASQSQSLVTAAEAHKTWETIYLRVKQLADIVSATRKGNVNKLNRLLPGKRTKAYPKRVVLWDENGIPLTSRKGNPVSRYAHRNMVPLDPSRLTEAGKLWLEYRYGWSPIVYDIVDTLKAVYVQDLKAELSKPRGPFTVARGKSSESWSKDTDLSSVVTGVGSLGKRVEAHELSCRAYILYRSALEGSLFERLNDFGLFNVPLAIWELVPLSFVVDWFVPVGDYLEAIQPKFGVEIVTSGFTYTHKVDVSQWLTQWGTVAKPTLGWPPFAPVGVPEKASILRWERSVGLGSPSFPPIDTNLGVKRLLDAAALLKGMRR